MCGLTRAPFNSNRSSCGIEVVVPFFSYPKFEHAQMFSVPMHRLLSMPSGAKVSLRCLTRSPVDTSCWSDEDRVPEITLRAPERRIGRIDREPASVARLRCGYREDTHRVRGTWSRGRSQRQPMAPRPRLALAPPGGGARVLDEHSSRCPFNCGDRSHALGCGDGPQGSRPEERLLNCLDSGGSWRISSSARLQGHAPRRAPAADQCMSRLLLQRYRERAVILPGVASARPPSQPASTRSMSRLRHSPR